MLYFLLGLIMGERDDHHMKPFMTEEDMKAFLNVLLVFVTVGAFFLAYVAGGTPFLYSHEFVHGENPTGSTFQIKTLDTNNKLLTGVPIVLETYQGSKEVSSDKDGYANFGMVFWRNTLPVSLGKGYEDCDFKLGPVYIGSSSPSTIKMIVSCP